MKQSTPFVFFNTMAVMFSSFTPRTTRKALPFSSPQTRLIGDAGLWRGMLARPTCSVKSSLLMTVTPIIFSFSVCERFVALLSSLSWAIHSHLVGGGVEDSLRTLAVLLAHRAHHLFPVAFEVVLDWHVASYTFSKTLCQAAIPLSASCCCRCARPCAPRP